MRRLTPLRAFLAVWAVVTAIGAVLTALTIQSDPLGVVAVVLAAVFWGPVLGGVAAALTSLVRRSLR